MFSDVGAVGIPWYRRGDYPRILAIMKDADSLPRTFREWEKAAHEALAFVQREGGTPVRVELRPDAFAAWCALRGLDVDNNARQLFASDPANWPPESKH